MIAQITQSNRRMHWLFTGAILMVALLSACGSSSTPIQASWTPHSSVEYWSYDWSTRPDYTQLRDTIGWSDEYIPRCENGRPTKKLVDALNTQQWQTAVSIGSAWLKQCPIDLRTHYFTAMAYQALGNTVAELNHRQWMEGLMESIMSTGDGQSPQSPFITISVAEEYDALYMFGLRSESQTLINTCLLYTSDAADD